MDLAADSMSTEAYWAVDWQLLFTSVSAALLRWLIQTNSISSCNTLILEVICDSHLNQNVVWLLFFLAISTMLEHFLNILDVNRILAMYIAAAALINQDVPWNKGYPPKIFLSNRSVSKWILYTQKTVSVYIQIHNWPLGEPQLQISIL